MSRGDLSSSSNTADENNREKLRQILCNLRKDPMDEDLVTFNCPIIIFLDTLQKLPKTELKEMIYFIS